MATNPLTISELTDEIKSILENKFFSVYVTGEISNYKHHSSGHHYFSLKDENSQISCTIWRNTSVNFSLKNGMKVIVRGELSVYAVQGKYQIICTSILPEGTGDLYLAFEKLKSELSEKGYFAQERKRELPLLPMKIGIATSPTGAAVQDMFSTIERRFCPTEIYFRPTLVQGEAAALDIVKAISELNEYDLDVIIIGRGGGSMEDLWCFNMEIVADAIYNSKTPIISAVGHETDFTISDFVADVRAATPTAAAEICTPISKVEFETRLIATKENLFTQINANLSNLKKFLQSTGSEILYRRLTEKIHFHEQRLDDRQNQVEMSLKNKLEKFTQKLDSLKFSLESLHPLQPLEKGFALIRQKNKVLKPNKVPAVNSELEIVRKDDLIIAKVLGTKLKMFDNV
ncbi:MAG: exodeoxyribonuclease VII large subunit [Ignavibacteria bacterium GWF2_33_9]|nr:MAG: exodeoxyribonuclease VII large subunit [Ignavibacteria bacterium GWF2_33_9]